MSYSQPDSFFVPRYGAVLGHGSRSEEAAGGRGVWDGGIALWCWHRSPDPPTPLPWLGAFWGGVLGVLVV